MAPAQQGDETIRSTESSSKGSIKSADKVKAYVDFSDYDRNYEDYMRTHGLNPDDDRPLSVIMKEAAERAKSRKCGHLDTTNKSVSSHSSEDWVVLAVDDSKSAE